MEEEDRCAAAFTYELSIEGRWFWVLENIQPIESFQVLGKKRLFEVDVPWVS